MVGEEYPVALILCPQAGKRIASPTKKCQPARGLSIGGQMPELGEIKRDHDIGRPSRGRKYIWAACLDCGKERWVRYDVRETKPESLHCLSCSGARGVAHSRWQGGRRKRKTGYIMIWLSPDDFFYPMAQKGGYVLEHRLVMAKRLGRCLQPRELVHHKNHKKGDNQDGNLTLVTDDRHNQITILENRIKVLETKITVLEAEAILRLAV